MAPGDLVLIVPSTSANDGGIRQLGVVKAICPTDCHAASGVLWPETPHEKLFPLVFVFDAEGGFRFWHDFLDDVGYSHQYSPRGKFRSVLREKFDRWGGEAGYLRFLRAQGNFSPVAVRQASASGAGFGSPEENERVERAAVSHVQQWYAGQGWSVESVEDRRCGYDLICSKGSLRDDVEVKGVSGSAQDFIITSGEVKQARTNPKFVLCVVMQALSDEPRMQRYQASEFLAGFGLEPIQFRATKLG